MGRLLLVLLPHLPRLPHLHSSLPGSSAMLQVSLVHRLEQVLAGQIAAALLPRIQCPILLT